MWIFDIDAEIWERNQINSAGGKSCVNMPKLSAARELLRRPDGRRSGCGRRAVLRHLLRLLSIFGDLGGVDILDR